MWLRAIIIFILAAAAVAPAPADELAAAPDYSRDVAPLFTRYCTGCHNPDDADGKLVLASYDTLLKGGEHGAVVTPGKSEDSRMIRMLLGKAKPVMPPADNERPKDVEIALIRAWIDAGAKGPTGAAPDPTVLVVPKIAPTRPVVAGISVVASSPDGSQVAIARRGEVEIVSMADNRRLHLLSGHAGAVNGLAFSRDGKKLVTAAGEPGLFGEAKLWNLAVGKPIATFRGHRDALYAARLSPDAALLATGGYDQKVTLWDVASGKQKQTIAGHNGAVFDLDFSPDGSLLATASADRTVKLWNVATGERLDTFGQPLKDMLCVAFSPDGKTIAAGSLDRRIRLWAVTSGGREGTNPLVFSRFAHDGAVLRIAYSRDGHTLVSAADNRTIKVWDADTMTLRQTLETQSDWTAGLALSADGKKLLVGRMNGSQATYDLKPFEPRPNGDAAAPEIDLSQTQLTTASAATPATQPTPVAEVEPNDTPAAAQKLDVSLGMAGVSGRMLAEMGRASDADAFKFSAKSGEAWILETVAAREQSPCDTKLEVLFADGKPVPRVVLQAVRDSSVTFRGTDANATGFRLTNWEEMDLNQYLYVGGEVCRTFRFPQGPDSDFVYYESNGRRKAYFDTTATAHYLDEPCYIVRPLPPGSNPVPTGLPTFPLNYVNDDDSDRKLGTDSRLTFVAPADADYLVRVTDTRGFGGEKFKYRLTVRRPRPEFKLSLSERNMTIGATSGKRFVVRAERIDGFDGDIRVDVTHAPAGFRITSPLVIAAGHDQAWGMIHAADGAAPPAKDAAAASKFVGAAVIDGRRVEQTIDGLGEIKVGPRPKLIVRLEPDVPASAVAKLSPNAAASTAPIAPEPVDAAVQMAPAEVKIVAGTTVTARLIIERNGFQGEVKFDVDNLPHGVIVDNIGLNGILITADQSERQIFLTSRPWVAPQKRLFHAVAQAEGNQASLPLMLVVAPAK